MVNSSVTYVRRSQSSYASVTFSQTKLMSYCFSLFGAGGKISCEAPTTKGMLPDKGAASEVKKDDSNLKAGD